ncbi:MAG: hypothetical protein QW724_04820 [Nitrososphaerota archaeon]
MFRLSDLFTDQQPPIEIDIDMIVQVAILVEAALSVVLMWMGIFEAWRMPRNSGTGYLKKSVYSVIVTILLFATFSLLGLPTKINPYFIDSLIYIGLAFLLAIMVILLSEKVRDAFLGKVPLTYTSKSGTPMPVYRDFLGSNSSISLPAGPANLKRVEGLSTAPRIALELTAPSKTVPVDRIQLREVVVKKEVPADLDYEMYENWIKSLYFSIPKISYEEFSRIRKVVNSVMKEEVFGMRKDKLDVKSLSLLAKIDHREDVEEIKKFSGGEYFRKLRKFELVSENGRLMARGVRLVKELKKEGLIEKLREQIQLY